MGLRVLLITDRDERVERIDGALRANDFEAQITVARTFGELHTMLEAAEFDVAICEHAPPALDQAEALDVLRSAAPELALLIVSDEVEAMTALDAVRAGASDWLINHSLTRRLGPAVERAVRERRDRLAHASTARRTEENERHYYELANALPQIVYEADADGYLTFINQRGRALLGLAETDERRMHLSDILTGEDLDRALQRLRRMTAGETPLDGMEFTACLPDGRQLPVMVFAAPIMRDGEVVGERGVVIDVTEVKRAQQQLAGSERRYRSLVDAMGDGLVTIDVEGNLTFVNQALADMVGREMDDLVGQNMRALLDEQNAALVSDRLGKRAAGAPPSSYEITIDLESGERVTLLITATALRDERGEAVGSLGVVKNITEQKRTREQLLRIKAGLDNAGDAIGIVDARNISAYANPAFEALFGCTGEEFVEAGGPIAFAADPEDYERAQQALSDVGWFAGELAMRGRHGRVFPAFARVNRVRDEQGETAGYVGVLSDISEQREREERLRLTNARLQLMNQLSQRLNAGDSPAEIVAAGVDGLRRIVEVDEAFVFMRDAEDDDGGLLTLTHASTSVEYRTARNEALLARMQGMKAVIDADSPLAPVYEPPGDLELRGTEAAADAVARLRLVEQPALPASLADGVRANGTGYIFSTPLVRGDTAIGSLSLSRRGDVPLTEDEKDVVRTFAEQLAIILDKARTEQELVRLNQFLQGIIDSVAIWFAVVDEARNLVIWNRAAEEISGYSREDLADVDDLVRRLYPEGALRDEVYDHVRRTQEGDTGAEVFETVIRRKDGTSRTVLWHVRRIAAPGADSSGGLIVVGNDVTERRELQEQLRRSQRMEAVGTFAGGIAHDFNNVLTAILGHTDLLAGDDADARARWHAMQIADAAARASGLTRQLLAFSRRQPVRPRIVDLNRVVRGMAEILRRLIRADIQVRYELAPDLGYTRADPVQIEQVIMNLVVNARDAMPEGGVLTISTTNAELSDGDMTELFDAAPGAYVRLSVADTGVGMDAATESHVFEPFFSTKTDTGGTGLGLATVYGIVRQSNGAITVYSEPGQGSVFRIYLPRTDRPEGLPHSEPAANREALRGSETLLIVEDTESLRTLIHTVLDGLGYKVLSAASGAAALALAAAHDGAIHLLVTDVIMPEMSGTDLAERLVENNPHLRVLYVSGYPTEAAIDAERRDERFTFLQKPFSATELGRKVREILDGDAPAH